MNRNIVVAITGASGAPYAVRLIEVLAAAGCTVHLTISGAAAEVFKYELGLTIDLENFEPAVLLPQAAEKIIYHHIRAIAAPIASGSFLTDGMVVCPCSTGTLSAIVHGTSTNLIHRAAEVHLKERRKLILVPRETPLSIIHLDNMKRAAEAGAIVLPAMPGFYHGVTKVQDLVDFIVARICDQLQVEHDLIRRWGGG
jgi:4-hydroxy-3-polyprenylbenzoate decarboxylase